jgi:hypothetical protein
MWRLNTFPRVCLPPSYFTFPTSRAGGLFAFLPSDVPILVLTYKTAATIIFRSYLTPAFPILFFLFLSMLTITIAS